MRFSGDDLCPAIRSELGEVQGATLTMRRPEPSDLAMLTILFADEQVWHYPYGRGLTPDETAAFLDGQIAHWKRYGFGLWMLDERPGDSLIGYAGLSIPAFLPEVLPAVEVGWRLSPRSWGRGYATQAGNAALSGAFQDLRLDRVVSLPQVDNVASWRVAERLGMSATGTVTVAATERRGPVEVVVYEMTVETWRQRRL